MRTFVLDVETTGLDDYDDRIVDVCLIELTSTGVGEIFTAYCNPDMPSSPEALAVHGLTEDFLRQHPPFSRIGEMVVSRLRGSHIVGHNVDFDMRFLNAELRRCGLESATSLVAQTSCTLAWARREYTGQKNDLRTVCERIGIDTRLHERHGAETDAFLCARLFSHIASTVGHPIDLPARNLPQRAIAAPLHTQITYPPNSKGIGFWLWLGVIFLPIIFMFKVAAGYKKYKHWQIVLAGFWTVFWAYAFFANHKTTDAPNQTTVAVAEIAQPQQTETEILRSDATDKGKYYLLSNTRKGDIVTETHKRLNADGTTSWTKSEVNCKTMKMRMLGVSDDSEAAIKIDKSKWFAIDDGAIKSDIAKFVCAR